MNYGKKGASKRQKQIASKSNMKKKRVGVRVFKALVACLLLVIVLGAVGGGLFIKNILDDTPSYTPRMEPRLSDSFLPAPTVSTRISTISLRIWAMHLSRSRTSVSTSTTVSICRVS